MGGEVKRGRKRRKGIRIIITMTMTNVNEQRRKKIKNKNNEFYDETGMNQDFVNCSHGLEKSRI